MNHKLTFASIYKSISSLNAPDLPEFVVLTGRNGSGKTHLLEAIAKGKVKSSLVANHSTEIMLYDWNTIIPKDTGVFHTHQHLTQRSSWFTNIRQHQEQHLPAIQQQLVDLGLPAEKCSSLSKIRKISPSMVSDFVSDKNNATQTYQKIQEILKNYGRQVYSQTFKYVNDETWKKIIPEIRNEKPELFLETSESRFFAEKKLLWGEVDPFQQAFGRLFSTYRDLIHQNDRLEKYPPEDESDLKYLPQDQFEKEYGEPPWIFVNKILEVCKMDFRVNKPPMHETSSFEPKLNKISSDVEMRFQDLSSGEKVLMSFALCIYNVKDLRQRKRFPKLLLLDEIDAPLHPSMVRSLLNTIQSVLVEDKKISVILTTHSPSTVALAPETALYEMNPDGPAIEKCSQGKALSILTADVPTLSVSFDGRRQVFVESKTDATRYHDLYLSYKRWINSERSLTFIEVGHKPTSGGEANSGCKQVKRIVDSLVEYGNQSVYGLVDWDGNVDPTDRIHVLSHKVRNGIESLLFDPLLLVAACIRDNIAFSQQKGIVCDDEAYTDLPKWDQTRWQSAVNVIQDLVIGSNPEECSGIEIKYLNGIQLTIRANYLHLDDHALEKKIVDKFGFFKPKNDHAGDLMKHICQSVLKDYPDFLPCDLIETFESLLNDPI